MEEKEEKEGRKEEKILPSRHRNRPSEALLDKCHWILSEIKSGRISDGTCKIIVALWGNLNIPPRVKTCVSDCRRATRGQGRSQSRVRYKCVAVTLQFVRLTWSSQPEVKITPVGTSAFNLEGVRRWLLIINYTCSPLFNLMKCLTAQNTGGD